MKITGLRVDDPEFYIQNEDAIWLSRLKFRENAQRNVALVDSVSDNARVFGIVKLGTPIRIKDVQDVSDQVPRGSIFEFQDVEGDIWAYSVETVLDFTDDPKPVKDGLMVGQRNFIRELDFAMHNPSSISKKDSSWIQQMHDRIHEAGKNRDLDFRDFLTHYHLAKAYEERDMNHPNMDGLDEHYETFAKHGDNPACRMENETKQQCMNRKIPHLVRVEGKDPDEAVGAAAGMCERACSESMSSDDVSFGTRRLIGNIGNWTKEDAQFFVNNPVPDELAEEMARVANKKFQEFSRHRSKRIAFQLAISSAVSHFERRTNNE